MNLTLPIAAAVFALLCPGLVAGPLRDAEVRRVVGEVAVAPAHGTLRSAASSEMLAPDEGLRAGVGSRAEILFADDTRARIGGGTDLGLRRGSRELTLDRGTLLLEVPGWRGGARVRAGELTVVCGEATILVEHLPSQSLKLVVLAGDVRVAAAGLFGDSLVIAPGKMLITTPNVKRIPEPVDVDLSTLVKTSTLIEASAFSPGAGALASLPQIEREIARQAGYFQKKRLIPTNLAIVGSGTSVVIPGQPGPEAETVTAGESVVLGGTSEEESRKSAETLPDSRATLAVERQNTLPEP